MDERKDNDHEKKIYQEIQHYSREISRNEKYFNELNTINNNNDAVNKRSAEYSAYYSGKIKYHSIYLAILLLLTFIAFLILIFLDFYFFCFFPLLLWCLIPLINFIMILYYIFKNENIKKNNEKYFSAKKVLQERMENTKSSINEMMYEKEKRTEEYNRIRNIRLAKNYEIALKYEEAINIYENLEMWEDVGRVKKILRKMQKEDREVVTKHIHVQANTLFEQIRKEGLAVPYKCPNCSGTLKITGKKIDTCPYCGSDMDLETLSDLVKIMLE